MIKHGKLLQRLGALAAVIIVGTAVNAAAAQDSAKLIPVRIAATPDAVSIPQWLAMKEGLFKKYGLDAKETVYNVNYQGLLAIGSRQGDVSIQSDPPTISALAKGIDAVAVAVVGRFPAGYKMVARKSITSVDDLKGKKVAWPTGTGAEYALISIAKAKDFKTSDFEQVDLFPAEAVPLLLKGDVSATFYWEPWARKALEQDDDLHVIMSSEGIYESNMFLTVGKEFAGEHPEGVEALLKVFKEAHAILDKSPEKGIEIFQERMRVDQKTAEDSMGDYEFMVTLDKQTQTSAESIAEWLKATKKIEKLPDWDAAFDAKFLKAVDADAAEGFTW